MRALDRKLMRDLKRLWAQALAVAMVMACGVATIIIATGAYRSLEETRRIFYERYRFASVFASAVRAPMHLQNRLQEISGVSAVELTIVQPVLLSIAGMREPASGIAISLPEYDKSRVNQLYIRRGRLPDPQRSSEVAIVENFAEAHGFRIGNSFDVVMEGKRRRLEIVGIVLTPEYIYAIGPGDMVPDDRRFGVLYMARSALAAAFDMEGAFNSVALTATKHANVDRIIEGVDSVLEPYGGAGAIDRTDQFSHAFLTAELDQLKTMAMIIPPIFLLVSAFLVNMILSRLISLEREQVGLFKAVGYGNLAISAHYGKLVVIISLAGLVIGSGFGWWAGRGLTRLYAEFFAFPFLIFRHSPDLYALAGGLTVFAALSGAAKAIIGIVVLPPAVAMRPPAPTVYRRLLGGNVLQRVFSQLSTMSFRHMARWPVRTLLTTLGTAMSVALLITSLFAYDSIEEMIDAIFFKMERQDATLTLSASQHRRVLSQITQLPGVLRAEPFRQTPVVLENGHRSLRMAVMGVVPEAKIGRVLDADGFPMTLANRGLALSERVAAKLHLRVGDKVRVVLSDQSDRVVEMPVVALSQSYVGLTAHTTLQNLNRILRDGMQISGARVSLDGNQLNAIYEQIKKTPMIASIALQDISRDQFRKTIKRNITTMTTVYVILAVTIAFGVVYNSARILLSERARELASLRVFGFTRAEVSGVLMSELAMIVLLAQPIGWLLGYSFAFSVTKGFESDLFRIPLVIASSTYATASLVVIGAALCSAAIVRRRVDRLDLIKVLKTRE